MSIGTHPAARIHVPYITLYMVHNYMATQWILYGLPY